MTKQLIFCGNKDYRNAENKQKDLEGHARRIFGRPWGALKGGCPWSGLCFRKLTLAALWRMDRRGEPEDLLESSGSCLEE